MDGLKFCKKSPLLYLTNNRISSDSLSQGPSVVLASTVFHIDSLLPVIRVKVTGYTVAFLHEEWQYMKVENIQLDFR